MNVLEKILEEMNKIKDGNRKEKLYAKYPAKNKRQEILNIYSQGYEDGTDNFYNAIVPLVRAGIPLICSRRNDNDELINRKALKEEIESLRMTITGMRSGKTITIRALEEYKKSILRIIDEQPTVHVNDNCIPVEENQLEPCYDVYFCEETECSEVNKEIRMDHKPTSEELKQFIIKFKMRSAWYVKRYIYNPCAGCFGAANNDCQHCRFGGGGQDE